jgi:hypothetical protein
MARQDDELLKLARDRYDFGRTADADDRAEAESDNAFANATDKDLGQWDDVAKRIRKKAKRPIRQWNRIPVYVQQVVNDGRQNKPAIRISPGDGGKQATAEYFQARIRHIEYEANADTAKDTARDQQVTSGRGSIRVRTENIPGTILPNGQAKQRICLDRIENQFSVVWDPAAVEYDRSDADWCFVISLISKDAHQRKYGKDSLVNRVDFAEAMELAPEWIGVGESGEMIQIAEYYVKEWRPRTICLLGSTGLPAWKDELEPAVYEQLKAQRQILAEREDQCATIKQYVINGAEVLSETEWIGSTIPIVPFWGREATVNGKRRTYSLTRNARGPQQDLNVAISNLTEMIGNMPKSRWKAAAGSIPPHLVDDYNANSGALILFYELYHNQNPTKPLPPPELLYQEPPIQALVVLINQCIDGIKAAMGIYDASLGARSNETSGYAIDTRKQQASVTNYHFPDNEARSNKYLGQILVEIIPKIDQAGGTYPIRTEDDKTHLVPIGVEHKDWKTGQVVCHDLKSGQYNVTVSTGPTYRSQRREIYDRDAQLVQANPELIWAIGPQMFRSDDTAGSEERAEALERYIKLKLPGLIPEKDQQGQEVPPQVQQAVQQLQQELQATQAFAQQLHTEAASKKAEHDHAEKLKQMDIDFQREKLTVDTQLKVDLEAFKQGIAADITDLKASLEVIRIERAAAAVERQREEQIEAAQQQPAPGADSSQVQQ